MGRILTIISVAGAIAISIILVIFPTNPVPIPPPPGLNFTRTEILATNLEVPWAIDIADDGTLFFTERVGRVNVIENGKVKTIFEKNVAAISEAGMLGLALDPDFNKNKHIYIYYTYAEESNLWNRVVRLDLINGKYEEGKILIDHIPAAAIHNGGRLKFGPDGMLYITTGDATLPELSQKLDSLAGKILRIKSDGSIPDDNPFQNSAVYSYGHRNPQGLAWHPITRALYNTEHGPVDNDEVNLIEAGKNYGWPEEECKSERYAAPIICYSIGVAPAGATFSNSNELFIATLKGKHIEHLILDDNGTSIKKRENFFSNYGRLRDIVEHDGYLYIATSNRDGRGTPATGDDKILRIALSS